MKSNLLSTPPVLLHGTIAFPISTEVSRIHVVNIILDDVNLDGPQTQQEVFHTKVDVHMWHRRTSHCNLRGLQQLADKETPGVKFNRNIESGDCEVCSTSNSKKISHPPSDRTRAQTRLEIVHVDLWWEHPIKSYRGFQTLVMLTDDKSRMRWGVPIKSKDEAAKALQTVVQDVADPEGLCIVKVNCDGGATFRGRFEALCESLGIIIPTNAPYIPQGNAIAGRELGTIIEECTGR